jgi:adenylyltransferase/sulfurtransferase
MTPAAALSDEELDRYARHIVLPQIGGAGQATLKAAHVAIIGAGGIGCPALLYLTAAGVGTITLIDDDDIALSNLQRQIAFGTADVGQSKVNVAAAAAVRLNAHVRIAPQRARIADANAAALLTGADIILDGCDNFATRLAVNRASIARRIPLISAAIGAFEGQIAHFRGWEDDQSCYACLVGDQPDRPEANCAEAGVLGALAGVIGTFAALEVVRALVPFGTALTGHLFLSDMIDRRVREIRIVKDPQCPACRKSI